MMAGFRSRFMTISTSPRSPYRIIHYLNLLKEFEGKPWNRDTQEKYYEKMVENQEGDFTIGLSNTPDFSARDKVNRAPRAFGFVKLRPTIELTESAKAFLNPYLSTETLIRQILKYQLPSPILPETSENKGYFNIRPFLELLRLIRKMGEISRNEFRAFGLTMTDYHSFDDVLENIHQYRIAEKNSTLPKRQFYNLYMKRYLTELYKDKIEDGDVAVRESRTISTENFVKTKMSNIRDYADAYLRFLIGTELVLVTKNKQIVISQDKYDEVDYILENTVRDAIDYTLEEYERVLFEPTIPSLLTDNIEVLNRKIVSVTDSIHKHHSNLTGDDLEFIPEHGTSILDLKAELHEKEEHLKHVAIEEYAVKLKKYNQDEIDDIIETYEGIKKKEYFDNPLFLEWNTWRAITMINNGNIKGGFKTNTFGEPIGTAGGNMADIVGNYGNFNMICEVTMSGGKRQYEMENEPIARHLGELRTKTSKPTFGLFIAPSINDSLVAELFYKHKIPTRIYNGTVEFIPFTIEQFVDFFRHSVTRSPRLTESDIESIHKKTKEIAENARDEVDWLKQIHEYIMSI